MLICQTTNLKLIYPVGYANPVKYTTIIKISGAKRQANFRSRYRGRVEVVYAEGFGQNQMSFRV